MVDVTSVSSRSPFRTIIRATAALTIVGSCGFALSACQADRKATASADSTISTMTLPADVSARGVLLAAVLLSTSDIEGALAEGLVTPAEVDLAQAAIDDGMLDQWRQRAERDLNSQ